MNIDIHTLSLIFCLTSFLEAIILGIQYKYLKGISFKGFLWWIAGICFIGFHFLALYLQRYFHFGISASIIENVTLVAGMLSLSHGILIFFNGYKKNIHTIIFVPLYVISTTIAYILGNITIPNAISALVISLFSFAAAFTILRKNGSIGRLLTTITFTTLIINAIFFLADAVLWFLIPSPDLSATPTVFQELSYFVLFIYSTIWTFSFVFLMNHKVMRDTIISKEKYNLMFETIPDAVLISHLDDGLLVEVNQGFTLMSGFTPSEIKGKTTLDIDFWFDPVDRSRFMVILTETGSIENMEFQFRKKNGRPLIGLLSARLIDIDGVPHALTVLRDITNRKRMEEKLRENEQKYRFLTENSGDVIWHINKSYQD